MSKVDLRRPDLLGGYDPLDNTLSKVLTAVETIADNTYVNNQRAALAAIENIYSLSDTFDSEEDYSNAKGVLENARRTLDGGVAQTMLDSFAVGIDKNHKAFTADTAIKEGLAITKQSLSNLTPFSTQGENLRSEQIGEIMTILDGLSTEYRSSASTNIQKQLSDMHQDVLTAIDVAAMFDNHDDRNDDDMWTFQNKHKKAKHAHDAYIAGDFKNAHKLMKQVEYKEDDQIWDNAGNGFRNKVLTMNLTSQQIRKSKYFKGDQHHALNKYVDKHPTTGLQALNRLNIDRVRQEYADLIGTIVMDEEIGFSDKLKEEYRLRGIEGLSNKIDSEIRGENIPSTTRVLPRQRLDYLQSNNAIDWVPDQGLGWDKYDSDEDAQLLAGEYFWNLMDTYLILGMGDDALKNYDASQNSISPSPAATGNANVYGPAFGTNKFVSK
tara:strand:- start:1325 stop:2638 length:1314 start_codon:yes stop_codon:yes gene_type:complete